MKKISLAILVGISIVYSGCNNEDPVVPIIEIPDDDPCTIGIEDSYMACVNEKDDSSFEVATWNIQNFPKTNNTIPSLVELINNFHADIIALQEVTSASELEDLDELLPNWEAELFVSSGINVGFLYNSCEIVEVSELKALDIGDSYSFPREPVEMTVTHKNGLEVTLINIHLKCCDDGIERREVASNLLEEYISSNYPEDNVILLGDFNGEINNNLSFQNFIDDEDNYRFTDMSIALGPESDFSYPSWPSHIDHILVTNELFDNIDYTETINFDGCFNNYANLVSDHRPVLLSLTAD